MGSSAASLRGHLDLVGRAKARARCDDVADHLAASLDERLAVTLRLSQQWLDALGDEERGEDDEAATWGRVLARLRMLAR